MAEINGKKTKTPKFDFSTEEVMSVMQWAMTMLALAENNDERLEAAGENEEVLDACAREFGFDDEFIAATMLKHGSRAALKLAGFKVI